MATAVAARSALRIDEILLGISPEMQAVRDRVARVASGGASVIVTGPSGSGKECVARALHAASDRRHAPFIAVNCGAIPRELMESELFGHERGAFTGAHAARAGRFEQAHGGTLFLDEIGDMPLDMQVKLLRVIEERAVERVGGNRLIDVDVRIVSATHRDLDVGIEDQSFREDLYYRLAVVPIHLPALSARTQDVPVLVDHFLTRPVGRRATVRFAPEGLDRLVAHEWPGNVRELRNLVERAAILHPGETLGAHDVDTLLSRPVRKTGATIAQMAMPVAPAPTPIRFDKPIDLAAEMARLEAEYIRDALEKTGGIVAAAARLLGLRRTTLIEKMRRYALDRATSQASAMGSMVSNAF